MAGITVRLVILLVATALITITGNAAVSRKFAPYNPSCLKNCDNVCRSKPNPRDCYDDCIVNCYPPVSNVASSNCKISCEKAACSRFISGNTNYSYRIVSFISLTSRVSNYYSLMLDDSFESCISEYLQNLLKLTNLFDVSDVNKLEGCKAFCSQNCNT